MESKKSPKGRKRSSKSGSGITNNNGGNTLTADDGTWDCSVCTFKNNAEAFKCSMCDVRKGTSTRKPRLNPDLVAAQQAQALTPPPPPFPGGEPSASIGSPMPSSSKSEVFNAPDEEAETELDLTPSPSLTTKVPKNTTTPSAASGRSTKKGETKRAYTKARLKNVDRTSATYHSVTVDDFTVVITEFRPKSKKEKKEKISIAAPVSSSDTSGQGPSSTENATFQKTSGGAMSEPGDPAADVAKDSKHELKDKMVDSTISVPMDHQNTVEDTTKPNVVPINDTSRSS